MIGLAAYYDKDKTINLCNADEGFAELLDQVAKVYDKESGSGEVIADEKTKEFLQRINEFPAEEFEEKLKGFQERQHPFFLQKAFVHFYVLPIARYIIKTLYESKKVRISFDGEVSPWFGRGNFDLMANGEAVRLPYQIRMEGREHYEMIVRNVIGVGNVLRVHVHAGPKGITVSFEDSFFLFVGKIILRVSGSYVTLTNSLSDSDGVIMDSSTDCEQLEEGVPTETVIGLTTEEKAGWTGWRLPWGDKVFACEKNGTIYQVFSSEWEHTIVSTAFASQALTKDDESERFAKYAFRLYERNGETELHFLDLSYPGSGRFQEQYARKYYSKEMRERKDGI